MKKQYVHYGCGLMAPEEWQNFDASPTLRIQKNPLLFIMLKSRLNTEFPKNVKYGDIIKGLPVEESSCDGVYCSHTLEHLSLEDFRQSLKNTYKILKPGGVFRCVVPDLEVAARSYIRELEKGNANASIRFVGHATLLGMHNRSKGLKSIITTTFGNSNHLWMWDKLSLAHELHLAGFKNIRECTFNDSSDPMFKLVEDEGRFLDAVAMECNK